MRFVSCIAIAVLLLGRSAAAQNIRQVSWSDSLVTVDNVARVCVRLVDIPTIANAPEANFAAAEAIQKGLELVVASAQAEAKKTPSEDNVMAAVRADSLRKANAQDLEGYRRLATEARDQANKWAALLTTLKDAKTLRQFCAAGGSPHSWRLDALPTRSDIKRASNFVVTVQNDSKTLTPLLSAFAGIDEQAIVGGIATFLVDRAGAEIQIAFINRFKEKACDATRKPVFEAVCNVLDQAENALHTSLMRDLRSAAEQDLRRLPRTAPLAAITRPGHVDQFGQTGRTAEVKRQEDFLLTAYLMGSLVEQLIAGTDPLQALSTALERDAGILKDPQGRGLFVSALARNDKDISLPVSAGLYRLALVSRVVPEDLGGKPAWPQDTTGRIMLVKALAVNIASWLPELGLKSDSAVKSSISAAATLSTQVRETKDRAEAIHKQLADVKAADTTRLAALAQLVDDGLAIAESWGSVIQGFPADPAHAGSLGDAALVASIKDMRIVAKGIAKRDYTQASLGVYALANRSKVLRLDPPEGTTKVIAFVTAAAQATSSDEFAKTLNDFAAPVQSYRAKRASKDWYAVVNGYLGAGGGSERANGGTEGYAGVAAPVGFEMGIGNLGKRQWSIGVMAQLIDVGTLASYRMNAGKDSLASEPKAGFAQVFSPGGYLVIGLPHLPISLGIGGNIAPQLRKLAADESKARNASRLGFMAAVDIPMFVIK